VLESNKYAAERGSNNSEMTRKWKETAVTKLENHERGCTAGLLASAGKFSLLVKVQAIRSKKLTIREVDYC
jgi:hypothetical protein